MTLSKFVNGMKQHNEIDYSMTEDELKLATEQGIVVFRTSMGDGEFVLEGALTDLCPQPSHFGLQPQPGDWRAVLEIHIDSEGFTIWSDEERHAAANVIRLYDELDNWMDIPHHIIQMRDKKHSMAWYLLFKHEDLVKAPPGSKRGCDRICELIEQHDKKHD